jgi:hypothetical protein
MKEIKKFDVLSVAKIYGLSMAIAGLLIGLLFGFIMSMVGMIAGSMHENPFFGSGLTAGLGILPVIFLPVFYGALGFIFGALGAFIYNLLARWVGGIEVEIRDKNIPNNQ